MEEQSEKYTDQNGNETWYLPSKGRVHYHRLDGPAVEFTSGMKAWYIDDKRHRLDGPAFEYASGTKEWWVNGKLHRLDGPAIERKNGAKRWFIDGKELRTEEVEEWLEENDIDLKTKEGQMAFKLRWL